MAWPSPSGFEGSVATAIVPDGPAVVYLWPPDKECRDLMRTFASIRDRPTWVTGSPPSWRGADASGPSARLVEFGFDITDDGAGGYLLVCYSMDRLYAADTWHETLEQAYESAEEQFGLRREEWKSPGGA